MSNKQQYTTADLWRDEVIDLIPAHIIRSNMDYYFSREFSELLEREYFEGCEPIEFIHKHIPE